MPKAKAKSSRKEVTEPCKCGSTVWATMPLMNTHGDVVPGWHFLICVKCKLYKMDKLDGA